MVFATADDRFHCLDLNRQRWLWSAHSPIGEPAYLRLSREAGDLPADGDILFATDGREKGIYALRYDPKKETIRVI